MAAKPRKATKKSSRSSTPKPASKASTRKASPRSQRSRAAKKSQAKQIERDAAADQDADGLFEFGEGGETHQTVDEGGLRLTTQQGIPVADDQNTLRVGDRGPSLLEDFHFREKIFHFDHERIPERVVALRHHPRRPVPTP